MKRRFVSVLCMIAFVIPAFAVSNASADGVAYVSPGTAYSFWDLTNGDGCGFHPAGSNWYNGRYDLSRMLAEAASVAVSAGWGANAWAKVFKTVQPTETGAFYARFYGYAMGQVTATGLATSDLWFKFRIYDQTNSEVVTEWNMVHLSAGGLWGEYYDGPVSASLAWTGYAGVQYGLEAYVSAKVYSVIFGAATADALGSYGFWYYHTDLYVPPPPRIFGGGCVAEGTQITMYDGTTMPVGDVKKGMQVLGYNLSSGLPVAETVIYTHTSRARTIEVINDGLLLTTLYDQPIFAKNETFTGWILNPCELQIGWQLFNPLTWSWFNITNISFMEGNFKVYDIGMDGPDNYIANGVLLDRKPIK